MQTAVDLDPRTHPTTSIEDTARVLGVAKSSAYVAVANGEIPSIRVGRRLLVPTAALRRMLQLADAASNPQDDAA